MDCTGIQKHESKICPRCAANFICKVGDVANCQCSSVKLTPDEYNYLTEKYGDCLCCFCMRAEQQTYTLDKFNAKMKFILRMDKSKLEDC